MTELCSICREIMDENKQNYMLICNHKFHTECIINSLRVNNECPVCRDTGGYKPLIANNYIDYDYDELNNLQNKKLSKIKIEDINNILKLMNEILESDSSIIKLKNEIKGHAKVYKKNTNELYRKIRGFQNNLDKKYLEEINNYLFTILASDEFEKGTNSKNIYKEKINELHQIIYKQIIDMGIPISALESLKFSSKIKIQFEKFNGLFIDNYFNEIYSTILKSVKKVNNNKTVII